MKHAIDILQAEDDKLTARITVASRSKKPGGWRDSEWAIHVGLMKLKHQQLFEAIQILKGVGKD